MSDRYQVEALRREGREVDLRVEVVSENAYSFPVEPNFALLLVIDADGRCALGREVARQLGLGHDLHDGAGDVDACEVGLRTIAQSFIDDVRIVSTEDLAPGAWTGEWGSIYWERDGVRQGRAVYRVRFTEARWIEHLQPGMRWGTSAYDMSGTEELDRGFLVEVLARDGARVALRVTPKHDLIEDASDEPRFVSCLLVERAQAGRTPLRRHVGGLDLLDAEALAAAAELFIASIARRARAAGDAPRALTLDVEMTDAAWAEHLEAGMRWAAFGFR
jgi:hypothetical protein